MAIIAISRQMGSGGYTIAAAVAKTLGYQYADRQILTRAAMAYDVPEAQIAEAADRRATGWLRFDDETQRYRIFLEAAYFSLAEHDDVVTAGRGIASLVRGVHHALRVRIIAPFDLRVSRIMRKDGLERTEAARRVRDYDREISTRIAYLFGPEWAIPENYDLVLNTVRDDPALYTGLLCELARHPQFHATPQSMQQVHDLSLAAQVRAAIARAPQTASVFPEVAAETGRILLKGNVRHPGIRDALVEVASRVPGVATISTEGIQISFYHTPAV